MWEDFLWFSSFERGKKWGTERSGHFGIGGCWAWNIFRATHLPTTFSSLKQGKPQIAFPQKIGFYQFFSHKLGQGVLEMSIQVIALIFHYHPSHMPWCLNIFNEETNLFILMLIPVFMHFQAWFWLYLNNILIIIIDTWTNMMDLAIELWHQATDTMKIH